MTWVLTCVGDPDKTSFSTSLTSDLSDIAAQHFGQITAINWLRPSLALDLFFEASGDPFDKASRGYLELAGYCHSNAIDFAVQMVHGREKKLFLADMESTIIREEILDEIARETGCEEVVAGITKAAMEGKLDFEDSLRARVRLLEGVPLSLLDDIKKRLTLNPGARQLVSTLDRHNIPSVLVSGGFTYFTSSIRDICGFAQDYANYLEIKDNYLTGKVVEPILGRAGKQETLENELRRRKIAAPEACSIGDGANDLALIASAGLGIAYHAKPSLRKVADCQIDFTALTTVLYFLGIPYSSFSAEI